jgi:transportin-1
LAFLQAAADEDDAHVVDAAKDIKPRFGSSGTKPAGGHAALAGDDYGYDGAHGEEGDNDDHNDDDEDDDDDDDDETANWTLRKCAALGLDELATAFQVFFSPFFQFLLTPARIQLISLCCSKDYLLPVLLPLLRQMLLHEDWLVREAAILAIGAIADGMIFFFAHHKTLFLLTLSRVQVAKRGCSRIFLSSYRSCWPIPNIPR